MKLISDKDWILFTPLLPGREAIGLNILKGETNGLYFTYPTRNCDWLAHPPTPMGGDNPREG